MNGYLKHEGRPLEGISKHLVHTRAEDARSFKTLHPGVPRLLSLDIPLLLSTLGHGLPGCQNLTNFATHNSRLTAVGVENLEGFCSAHTGRNYSTIVKLHTSSRTDHTDVFREDPPVCSILTSSGTDSRKLRVRTGSL